MKNLEFKVLYLIFFISMSHAFITLALRSKIAAIREAVEDCVEQLPEIICLRSRVLVQFIRFYWRIYELYQIKLTLSDPQEENFSTTTTFGTKFDLWNLFFYLSSNIIILEHCTDAMKCNTQTIKPAESRFKKQQRIWFKIQLYFSEKSRVEC